MKSGNKKALIWMIPLVLVGLLLLILAGAFIRQAVLDQWMNDDISGIFSEERYQAPVAVEGVPVVRQEVSCGYAVLEMFGQWAGKDLTEESLYAEYGKVVTSTGDSFTAEMNRQFPERTAEIYKNCANTELLGRMYDSLAAGVPVPFEFAALYHGEDGGVWTLHYALAVAMDIPNDRITILNPYGYEETYTLEDFLRATRFESYEDMPFYFRLAFAFGLFEKNTVIISQ